MSSSDTLIPLLRIPSLGRIGSTKIVLPKWQNIDILNRGIRVVSSLDSFTNLETTNCFGEIEFVYLILYGFVSSKYIFVKPSDLSESGI